MIVAALANLVIWCQSKGNVVWSFITRRISYWGTWIYTNIFHTWHKIFNITYNSFHLMWKMRGACKYTCSICITLWVCNMEMLYSRISQECLIIEVLCIGNKNTLVFGFKDYLKWCICCSKGMYTDYMIYIPCVSLKRVQVISDI